MATATEPAMTTPAMTTADPATTEQVISALLIVLVQFGIVATLLAILVTALMVSVGIWIVARMMRVQVGYWICVMAVVVGAVIGTVALMPVSLMLKDHEALKTWLPWILQAVITAAILMRFIGVGLFKTFVMVFVGEIVAIVLACLLLVVIAFATGKSGSAPPSSSPGVTSDPPIEKR